MSDRQSQQTVLIHSGGKQIKFHIPEGMEQVFLGHPKKGDKYVSTSTLQLIEISPEDYIDDASEFDCLLRPKQKFING